ncbi:MAG: DNA repair exonuclease [Oligoflexales bacterium]|nr:DNA repair exonuclease [Oligoflexales bacterium]
MNIATHFSGKSLKFIHCADLHIDSPLRKLSTYTDAPVDKIKSATRHAFEKIIQHCLDENVDFLLISGDLFDGNCRDFNTILWICSQARRLGETPILIVHGNHDYANGLARLIPWPKNVHLFPCEAPSTKTFQTTSGIAVAVHGQSYSRPAVKENLALGFPSPVAGAFNIGLLHCNFEGSSHHDPYAPCKRDDLVSKEYQYWALGHIHKAIIYEPAKPGEPWIVYPGNIQGRHIRESGPKGCYLVSAKQDGLARKPEFLSTDTLRWHELKLEVTASHSCMEDLLLSLEKKLEALINADSKQTTALRVHLYGKASLCKELLSNWPKTELQIRDLCSQYQNIWLEKIKNGLQAAQDLDELRENPLFSEIIEDFEHLLGSGEHREILESWAKEVAKATGDLVHKSQWDQGKNISQIVEKSRAYLLGQLSEGGFFED